LARSGSDFRQYSLDATECVAAYCKQIDAKSEKIQILARMLHNVQSMPREFAFRLYRLRTAISREIAIFKDDHVWFVDHDHLLGRDTNIQRAGVWLSEKISSGEEGSIPNINERKLRHRMDCAKLSIDVANRLNCPRLARWGRLIRTCENVLADGHAIACAAAPH
jgi:hypothetical protein